MEDLSAFNNGAGREIQITDTLANLIGKLPLYGYKFQGQRYDCGSRVGFLLANLAFALSQGDTGGQDDLGEKFAFGATRHYKHLSLPLT